MVILVALYMKSICSSMDQLSKSNKNIATICLGATQSLRLNRGSELGKYSSVSHFKKGYTALISKHRRPLMYPRTKKSTSLQAGQVSGEKGGPPSVNVAHVYVVLRYCISFEIKCKVTCNITSGRLPSKEERVFLHIKEVLPLLSKSAVLYSCSLHRGWSKLFWPEPLLLFLSSTKSFECISSCVSSRSTSPYFGNTDN